MNSSTGGREQGPGFYDERHSERAAKKQHYTESEYYGLWATVLDRLRLQRKRRILEIGCGAGQLAHAIRDMGLAEDYLGLDFSHVAVKIAKSTNPGWRFICADVFVDQSLEEEPYDIVLSTEFLEHVEADLSVLARVRPGAMVIASVPNFPHVAHVRHFTDAKAVHDRYAAFFDSLYVVPIMLHKIGLRHFLMQGQRRIG